MQEAKPLLQLLGPKPASPHPLPTPSQLRQEAGAPERTEKGKTWREGIEEGCLGQTRKGQRGTKRLKLSAALLLEITLGIIEKQSSNAILECEITAQVPFESLFINTFN